MHRTLTRSKSETNLTIKTGTGKDSYGRNYKMVDGIFLNKYGIDLDLYELGKEGNITKEDLTKKIEGVISNLGEGNHSLYSRTWHRINEDYWLNHLTIVQYTPLAESFFTTPMTKTPFPSLLPYDSIVKLLPERTSKLLPERLPTNLGLNWEIRKWRILEEMIRILGDSSGIMGITEMDNFYNFFYPALKILGYEGVFVPKTKSLGVVAGWYSEGCALFWNYRDFKLKTLETGNYPRTGDIYLIAILEKRLNNSQIVTVVTSFNNSNSDQEISNIIEKIQKYNLPTIIILDSNSSENINKIESHNFKHISGTKNNSIFYRKLNLISNLTTPHIDPYSLPNNRYPSHKFCLASKLSY